MVFVLQILFCHLWTSLFHNGFMEICQRLRWSRKVRKRNSSLQFGGLCIGRQVVQERHSWKHCLQHWLLPNYNKPFRTLETRLVRNEDSPRGVYLSLLFSKHIDTNSSVQLPESQPQWSSRCCKQQVALQPRVTLLCPVLCLQILCDYQGILQSSGLGLCSIRSRVLLHGGYAVICQSQGTLIMFHG